MLAKGLKRIASLLFVGSMMFVLLSAFCTETYARGCFLVGGQCGATPSDDEDDDAPGQVNPCIGFSSVKTAEGELWEEGYNCEECIRNYGNGNKQTYYQCTPKATPAGYTAGLKVCETKCQEHTIPDAPNRFTGNNLNGRCAPVEGLQANDPGDCKTYDIPEYVYGHKIEGKMIRDLLSSDPDVASERRCYADIESLKGGNYTTTLPGGNDEKHCYNYDTQKGSNGKSCYANGEKVDDTYTTDTRNADIFEVSVKKGKMRIIELGKSPVEVDVKTCYKATGCNNDKNWYKASEFETEIFTSDVETSDGISCHQARGCNKSKGWYSYDDLGKYTEFFKFETKESSRVTCYRVKGIAANAYSSEPDPHFFTSELKEATDGNKTYRSWVVRDKAANAYYRDQLKENFFKYDEAKAYKDGSSQEVTYYIVNKKTPCMENAYSDKPVATHFSSASEKQFVNGSSTEKECWNITGKGTNAYAEDEKIGTHFAYDEGKEGFLNGTTDKVKYFNVKDCAGKAYKEKLNPEYFAYDNNGAGITRKKNGLDENLTCYNVTGCRENYAYLSKAKPTHFAYDDGKKQFFNGDGEERYCYKLQGCAANAYTSKEDEKHFAYDAGEDSYQSGNKLTCYNIKGCSAIAKLEAGKDKLHFDYDDGVKGHFNSDNAETTCYLAKGCSAASALNTALDKVVYVYDGGATENSIVCHRVLSCNKGYSQAQANNGYGLACTQCGAGYYNETAGASECTACAAGTSSSAKGAVSKNTCKNCAAGKWSNAGSAECTEDCEPGYACHDGTKVGCEAGTHATAGSAECDDCAAGTYSGAKAENCTNCADGKWSDEGSSECKDNCEAGNSCKDGEKKVCTPGTYAPAGSAGCLPCAGNTHSASGAQECTQCTPNYVNDDHTGCDVYVLEGPGTVQIYANGHKYLGTQAPNDMALTYKVTSTKNGQPYPYAVSSDSDACFLRIEENNEVYIGCDPNYSTNSRTVTFTLTQDRGLSNHNYTVTIKVIQGADSCEKGSLDGCAAGYAQSVVGTAISGRNCYACAQCPCGTWAAKGNAQCFNCPAGTASSKVGATSQDECKQCPAGQFAPKGSCKCKPCQTDPTKQVSEVAGSEKCHDCVDGSYANEEQTGCEQCKEGSKCNNGVITACPVGTHQDNKSQTECLQCLAGWYQDETGQAYCKPCGAGTYSAAGASNCKKCLPGHYAGEKATECSTCQPGTYQDEKEQGGCKTCPAGHKCPEKGMTSAGACEAGTYQDATGQTSCKSCGDGMISGKGADKCTPCEAGKYANNAHTECLTCPEGSKCTGDGKKVECEAGTYAPAGSSECVPCGDGMISGKGADKCTTCEAGKYANNAHTECLTCPEGSKCTGDGKKTECEAGKYAPAGSSECTTCAGNTYSVAGAKACTTCAPDYVNDNHTGCDKYTLSANGTTVGAAGGDATISVVSKKNDAKHAFTVTGGSASTCHATKNDYAIVVTCEPNTATSARTVDFTLTQNRGLNNVNNSITITVKQLADGCESGYTLGATPSSCHEGNGYVTVNSTAGQNCYKAKTACDQGTTATVNGATYVDNGKCLGDTHCRDEYKFSAAKDTVALTSAAAGNAEVAVVSTKNGADKQNFTVTHNSGDNFCTVTAVPASNKVTFSCTDNKGAARSGKYRLKQDTSNATVDITVTQVADGCSNGSSKTPCECGYAQSTTTSAGGDTCYVCTKCTAGTYAVKGATKCTACSDGTWAAAGACECKACANKPTTERSCGCNGKQTRSVKCDATNGNWNTGDWLNNCNSICKPYEYCDGNEEKGSCLSCDSLYKESDGWYRNNVPSGCYVAGKERKTCGEYTYTKYSLVASDCTLTPDTECYNYSNNVKAADGKTYYYGMSDKYVFTSASGTLSLSAKAQSGSIEVTSRKSCVPQYYDATFSGISATADNSLSEDIRASSNVAGLTNSERVGMLAMSVGDGLAYNAASNLLSGTDFCSFNVDLSAGRLNYECGANTSGSSRQAPYKLTQNESKNKLTLTVTQSADSCSVGKLKCDAGLSKTQVGTSVAGMPCYECQSCDEMYPAYSNQTGKGWSTSIMSGCYEIVETAVCEGKTYYNFNHISRQGYTQVTNMSDCYKYDTKVAADGSICARISGSNCSSAQTCYNDSCVDCSSRYTAGNGYYPEGQSPSGCYTKGSAITCGSVKYYKWSPSSTSCSTGKYWDADSCSCKDYECNKDSDCHNKSGNMIGYCGRSCASRHALCMGKASEEMSLCSKGAGGNNTAYNNCKNNYEAAKSTCNGFLSYGCPICVNHKCAGTQTKQDFDNECMTPRTETQSCGCGGTQSRTCYHGDGGTDYCLSWGACSKAACSDSETCCNGTCKSNNPTGTRPASMQRCNDDGYERRSVVWNSCQQKFEVGEWGACSNSCSGLGASSIKGYYCDITDFGNISGNYKPIGSANITDLGGSIGKVYYRDGFNWYSAYNWCAAMGGSLLTGSEIQSYQYSFHDFNIWGSAWSSQKCLTDGSNSTCTSGFRDGTDGPAAYGTALEYWAKAGDRSESMNAICKNVKNCGNQCKSDETCYNGECKASINEETRSCGCGGTQTRTCTFNNGSYTCPSTWSECVGTSCTGNQTCYNGKCYNKTKVETASCDNCGIKKRTCTFSNGSYSCPSTWGSCSASQCASSQTCCSGSCVSNAPHGTRPSGEQACECGERSTRTVTWNVCAQKYDVGEWSQCPQPTCCLTDTHLGWCEQWANFQEVCIHNSELAEFIKEADREAERTGGTYYITNGEYNSCVYTTW